MELVSTSDGLVLTGCTVELNRTGLWLLWDNGWGSRRVSLDDDEWIDHITEVVSPPDPQDDTPISHESKRLSEMWGYEPGATVIFNGCVVYAKAAPFLNLNSKDPLRDFRHSVAENLLRNPNFHAGMEGSSQREREAVAAQMTSLQANGQGKNQ